MKTPRITLRTAEPSHARRLHALIAKHRDEGHLLPRTLDELTVHADRFVIALRGRSIVGCGELAPLSPHVAEVRSLAVNAVVRDGGVGATIVEEIRRRARRSGFEKLCAFTHAPGYFSRLGFSIVPHLWISDKIFTDCVKCPLFRRCGQYAMEISLEDGRERTMDTDTTVGGQAL
jgi:amino-acid N-acetyltransferase